MHDGQGIAILQRGVWFGIAHSVCLPSQSKYLQPVQYMKWIVGSAQVRAARAAQAAAQATLAPPDAEGNEASEGALPADLPAFGKGIAFVPRSRRGTANGSAIGEAAASGRAGSGAEGSTEGGTEGRARGGAAGAVGVDRLGVGQGAMALDEGLAGEDGAEEVH